MKKIVFRTHSGNCTVFGEIKETTDVLSEINIVSCNEFPNGAKFSIPTRSIVSINEFNVETILLQI